MKYRLAVVTLFACLAIPVNQAAAASLPDPTRPYRYDNTIAAGDYRGAQAINWQLNGVKITSAARSAILNGKLVKEGDVLDNATVLEIRPSEVILLQDQRRIAVKLLISDIKHPVPENSRQ